MQTQLAYQRRDEFDQELLRRQWRLKYEAIQFLQLMYTSANGSPHKGIEGDFLRHPIDGPLYVMVAENQQLIADLLKLTNDGGVRAICRDLESLGILKRRTKPVGGGGKRTRYVLSLRLLLEIREHDPDSMIAQELRDLLEESPFSDDYDRQDDRQDDRIMNHDHDHEHALNKTHDHEHAHDHESFESFDFESQESQPGNSGSEISNLKSEIHAVPTAVSFSAISDEHARRIVQDFDVGLFAAYFDDALSANWARDCLDDRTRMAGLFHQVIRIGKAKIIGATIAAAWRNRDASGQRHGKPLALKLSQSDQDFASKLLRSGEPQGVSPRCSSVPIAPLKVPLDGEDSGLCLSSSESARQSQLRASQLAVLAAMQR